MKFCCHSIRDRALIAFLMATGCRISEVTQLNREDVDLSRLECTVLGKGNKERTVYFDGVTAALIRTYMEQRKDSSPALFAGRGTDRITPHGVRKMLKVLANGANVDHVHPHKFRRTLATNLIRHGMQIQEVAAILGHDKLDTTMQYVVLDKSDVAHSYRKYA
jgi:site-specific recombinase XerD